MLFITVIVAALIGYLIGSIPTGYWVGCLLRGIDIRTLGSGNLGATNVFRVLGWKAGVGTLIIDIAKGSLAVVIAMYWISMQSASNTLVTWTAGIGAILGHSFSFFVRFRGGKGVATAAGVFVALLPVEALVALGTFLAVFAFSRIVSLSSMLAAIALAIATLLITKDPRQTAMTAAIAGFVIWRHRANIHRLLNGTESRISFAKKEATQ